MQKFRLIAADANSAFISAIRCCCPIQSTPRFNPNLRNHNRPLTEYGKGHAQAKLGTSCKRIQRYSLSSMKKQRRTSIDMAGSRIIIPLNRITDDFGFVGCVAGAEDGRRRFLGFILIWTRPRSAEQKLYARIRVFQIAASLNLYE